VCVCVCVCIYWRNYARVRACARRRGDYFRFAPSRARFARKFRAEKKRVFASVARHEINNRNNKNNNRCDIFRKTKTITCESLSRFSRVFPLPPFFHRNCRRHFSFLSNQRSALDETLAAKLLTKYFGSIFASDGFVHLNRLEQIWTDWIDPR